MRRFLAAALALVVFATPALADSALFNPSSATPGGTNGNCQYNLSGAFGGTTGCNSDGTITSFGSGSLKLNGASSGTTILNGAASGGATITLPAGTDTLVGKATIDILTNKTFDTAGAGNSFSINGLAATANTGTGSVVRGTSPSISGATLTTSTYNGLTVNSTTGTLALTNAKTLTVSNSMTLTASDGSTLAIGGGGTLGSNAYTSTAYLPLAGGTMVGDLLFTDATYDIGKSAATRPRNIFASGTGTFGGAVTTGTITDNGDLLIGSGNGFKIANIFDINQLSSAGATLGGTKCFVWVSSTTLSATPDTRLCRSSAGLVSVDTTTSGNGLGSVLASAYIAAGSAPTLTGTCTTGSQTGGNTAGSFTATCTAQTVIITFATTAPTGWICDAKDQTTAADVLSQSAGSSSTTSCTLSGTTVAADRIVFSARAF